MGIHRLGSMNSDEYANATRDELILKAAEIVLAVRMGTTASPNFVRNTERFAELFLMFDDWLARGGDLPDEWKRP